MEMLVAATSWRSDRPPGNLREVPDESELAHHVTGWPWPGDGRIAESWAGIGSAEGQFTAERRRGIVADITKAVLDAEHGDYDRDPMRVWVFTPEIPDGTWGGGGRVVTLADIVGFALGDPEAGRVHAERVLAQRRGEPVPAPG